MHAQDNLLIVAALVRYSHQYREADPDRADRAWTLAASIAADHGLAVEDAVRQLEDDVNAELVGGGETIAET